MVPLAQLGSTTMDEEYLTVAEIAGVLKLNQQTVRNWIDQGKLPALHVGRRVRIKRSDSTGSSRRATPGLWLLPPCRPSEASGTERSRYPFCPG